MFLFRIVPAQDAVDEWLRGIAGDLPPAYLVSDDGDPSDAVRAYGTTMREWVMTRSRTAGLTLASRADLFLVAGSDGPSAEVVHSLPA